MVADTATIISFIALVLLRLLEVTPAEYLTGMLFMPQYCGFFYAHNQYIS